MPSCAHCQLRRMDILFGACYDLVEDPCNHCSDWWVKIEHGNKYPIPPGGDITKVGMVELTKI